MHCWQHIVSAVMQLTGWSAMLATSFSTESTSISLDMLFQTSNLSTNTSRSFLYAEEWSESRWVFRFFNRSLSCQRWLFCRPQWLTHSNPTFHVGTANINRQYINITKSQHSSNPLDSFTSFAMRRYHMLQNSTDRKVAESFPWIVPLSKLYKNEVPSTELPERYTLFQSYSPHKV
jgi:hypothetical protein